MSTIHEQTIDLRELPTKKVTLYPLKAEILREIGNVTLKPGLNEISIFGVTPTADKDSIKVEAHGSTTVTDIVVELMKNPDSFEDLYPLDKDDSEDESETEPEKPQDIKDLELEIQKLQVQHDAHAETVSNNTQSLQILESLINKFEFKKPEEMASTMQIYQERRTAYYDALSNAKGLKHGVSKQIAELKLQRQKLKDRQEKQHLKSKIEKEKAREKARRAKSKARESKYSEILEKARFWPQKVYKIKVTIEVNILTPGTSRRGSFDSLATANTIKADDSHSEPTTTSLLLTYIVEGACWMPKYDLNISTVTETGILNYHAEIHNGTSETWRDAKVILSTSRTAFAKVSEPIPVIKPWMLQLLKAGTFGATDSRYALSFQEQNQARSSNNQNVASANPNRVHLGISSEISQRLAAIHGGPHNNTHHDYQMQLMLLEQQNKKRLLMARQEQEQQHQMQSQQMQQMPQMPQMTQVQAPPPGGALFGMAPPPPAPEASAAPASFGRGNLDVASKESSRYRKRAASDAMEQCDSDEYSDAPKTPTPDADWEESGLTTTLELRGARTIPPSLSARRFKIATVRLSQLSLTHIVVPKLRAEAFLRARIINTSPSALLKGTAGLTLDGTFLGHTTLPRCSAGENFPLPLGVDPAISVSYPTPASRKNLNTGMFNKELSSTFSRAVILTNTRNGGAAVNLTVRDQVPVSQDERLKIEILLPRGLQEEGDKAKTGVEFLSAQTAKIDGKSTSGSSASGSADRSNSVSKNTAQAWGSAIAKLNKFGAIEWNVTLNPGKSVRLNLEYMIRYPGTESPAEAFKVGASPLR